MMYGLERLAEIPLSLGSSGKCTRASYEADVAAPRIQRVPPLSNSIGGTRPGNALFVPPPVGDRIPVWTNLKVSIHEDASRLPPLVKAGLLHVQFETIHPFLDGNGRIGRLLVTLYLCIEGVLRKPLLYLSLYLKTHRADYYRLCRRCVNTARGKLRLIFPRRIAETANQAFDAATQIVELFKRDGQDRIESERAERSFAACGSMTCFSKIHLPLQRRWWSELD